MKKFKVLFCLLLLVIGINIGLEINGVEVLVDGGAIITSAEVIQSKTGTGPWDSDDSPGNDSSDDNDIVRSFDQVTWTIENTMRVTDGSSGYNGGTIFFEAKLPDTLSNGIAKWNTEAMAWIENANLSADGLTLTGSYKMEENTITIPGKQTLVFVANILGAPNGLEVAPIIKTWLNGNTESEYMTTIP